MPLLRPLFRIVLVAMLTPSLHAQGEIKPLPDPKILLERVMATVKNLAPRRESYMYLEEETERKLDRKGLPKTTSTKTYEVTLLPGGQVRRLLTEDGQPLSEERAKAEELRIQTQLKAREARKLTPDGKEKPKAGREFMITVSDLLAALEFVKMERTTYKDHPVLALDFHPRKGSDTSGLGQRLASKWEGRLLVEESTAQVVRAEGRMLESCWVGGGFLGAIAPPSTFSFEQAEVAEGLWMPVQGKFMLFARITFVPVRMEMSTRCYDFRRFEAGEPVIGKALLIKDH